MAKNIGEVQITLNYDVASAALASIRNATLTPTNKPEEMVKLLREINAIASLALEQACVVAGEKPAQRIIE